MYRMSHSIQKANEAMQISYSLLTSTIGLTLSFCQQKFISCLIWTVSFFSSALEEHNGMWLLMTTLFFCPLMWFLSTIHVCPVYIRSSWWLHHECWIYMTMSIRLFILMFLCGSTVAILTSIDGCWDIVKFCQHSLLTFSGKSWRI